MHEVAGEAQKIVDVAVRSQLINNLIASDYSKDGWLLLEYDDQVLADYMDHWSAHGELPAVRFLHAEVVRLSQQPGYDPCEP